jgi:hypothetical protein
MQGNVGISIKEVDLPADQQVEDQQLALRSGDSKTIK